MYENEFQFLCVFLKMLLYRNTEQKLIISLWFASVAIIYGAFVTCGFLKPLLKTNYSDCNLLG